ncbi:MAG TPA: tRNA lysidine(34) synthetase TilS [Acidimicrobiia bacterium]|nr:tRNA lysidine(34) synthetase TilS [Acidimicrobiia bacterium]
MAEVAAELPPGSVLVALSGGADSAAMAYAVAGSGAPARAVTVHHHLPGSGSLVRAATEIADHLGLEHVIIDAPGGDTETELRQSRLEALEKARDSAEWILTGHTRDDQAETVLGNLIRGAGSGGLRGIPRRRFPWARPLLGIPRDRARAVARAAELPFVDDPQNDDVSVRRNRLRQEVIPLLEREFNPGLREALARTADFVAADDEMLEARAGEVPIRHDEEAVLVPAAALVALPAPVAARVARRALRIVLDPYPGTAADVAAVLAAVSGTAGQIAGGFLAQREGPYVAVHAGEPPSPPEPVGLEIPGEVVFGPWRVVSGAPGSAGLGRHGAVVPEGPLVVRAARPGDRIAIPGGAKKVSDALSEAGVPSRLRARWPVLESDGRIVWVVAIRVAAGQGGDVGVAAVKT